MRNIRHCENNLALSCLWRIWMGKGNWSLRELISRKTKFRKYNYLHNIFYLQLTEQGLVAEVHRDEPHVTARLLCPQYDLVQQLQSDSCIKWVIDHVFVSFPEASNLVNKYFLIFSESRVEKTRKVFMKYSGSQQSQESSYHYCYH